MSCCIKCGKEVSKNEIGLNKKLINRGAKEFMCLNCLAKYFNVSDKALADKIEQFKAMGCTLFL